MVQSSSLLSDSNKLCCWFSRPWELKKHTTLIFRRGSGSVRKSSLTFEDFCICVCEQPGYETIKRGHSENTCRLINANQHSWWKFVLGNTVRIDFTTIPRIDKVFLYPGRHTLSSFLHRYSRMFMKVLPVGVWVQVCRRFIIIMDISFSVCVCVWSIGWCLSNLYMYVPGGLVLQKGNYWCDGDGLLILITIFVLIGLFYFQVSSLDDNIKIIIIQNK